MPKQYFTVEEAVAMIERMDDEDAEMDTIDLVVIPPEADTLTDEEIIDDGDMENHLTHTPHDLAGTTEIHLPSTSNPQNVEKSRTQSKKNKTVNWNRP